MKFVEIHMSRKGECPICYGQGRMFLPCPVCRGRNSKGCGGCGGSGQVYVTCQRCGGSGKG